MSSIYIYLFNVHTKVWPVNNRTYSSNRNIIRHSSQPCLTVHLPLAVNAVSLYSSPSSDFSGRNRFYGLSHSSIWHGPQTVEHGSPYLLQEQRSVLQAVEQLQYMIFNRLSGAAFIVDITGTSRLSCRFHAQFLGSIPSSFPAQTKTWNEVW